MIWVSFATFIVAVISVIIAMASRPDSNERITSLIVIGLAGIVTVITLTLSFFTVVPSGHVGVQVIFGDVSTEPSSIRDEGISTKNPFAGVKKYNIQTLTFTMSGEDAITALTKDGLLVPMDLTVTYRLLRDDAAWVHQNLGEKYGNKILRPQTRTAIRVATKEFKFDSAYAAGRDSLEQRINDIVAERINVILKDEYPTFDGEAFKVSVALRNIQPPPEVKLAIDKKLAAQQQAEAMQYVKQKERDEADRKRIEAQGIQDFQNIVSQGISDQLLQWKGIEATMAIAESPNTKIIIIGSGEDGLPIILNTD